MTLVQQRTWWSVSTEYTNMMIAAPITDADITESNRNHDSLRCLIMALAKKLNLKVSWSFPILPRHYVEPLNARNYTCLHKVSFDIGNVESLLFTRWHSHWLTNYLEVVDGKNFCWCTNCALCNLKILSFLPIPVGMIPERSWRILWLWTTINP